MLSDSVIAVWIAVCAVWIAIHTGEEAFRTGTMHCDPVQPMQGTSASNRKLVSFAADDAPVTLGCYLEQHMILES